MSPEHSIRFDFLFLTNLASIIFTPTVTPATLPRVCLGHNWSMSDCNNVTPSPHAGKSAGNFTINIPGWRNWNNHIEQLKASRISKYEIHWVEWRKNIEFAELNSRMFIDSLVLEKHSKVKELDVSSCKNGLQKINERTNCRTQIKKLIYDINI